MSIKVLQQTAGLDGVLKFNGSSSPPLLTYCVRHIGGGMSASLTYVSRTPVDNTKRSAVLEFINHDISEYQWWAESMAFFDDPHRPDHLIGNTKLLLLIDDPSKDSFMASSDMDRIVCALERASASFGVDWELFLADTPSGLISKGKRDEQTAQSIEGLLSICHALGVNPGNLSRTDILEQYRDR